MPADQLVLATTTGPNHLRGTWIHPRLAVDLARWCSPQFAVWMDGWFLEQVQQPAAAPSEIPGAAWNPNTFADQPINVRAAQWLLHDAETGGDRAVRYWKADFARQQEQKRSKARPHFMITAPSSRAALMAIQEFNANGSQCTTHDVEEVLGDWAPATIRNVLSHLRRGGLVCKRGFGLFLTNKGEQLTSTF